MLHENSMACSHTMLEILKDALKHNVFASFTPTFKCLHVPNVRIRKNREMVGASKHEFRVNTHRFKISQGIREHVSSKHL